jgi:hypothetical protein
MSDSKNNFSGVLDVLSLSSDELDYNAILEQQKSNLNSLILIDQGNEQVDLLSKKWELAYLDKQQDIENLKDEVFSFESYSVQDIGSVEEGRSKIQELTSLKTRASEAKDDLLDLQREFQKDKEKYRKMPQGIYSGFKYAKKVHNDYGIIALLGYPTRPAKAVNHEYKNFDLVYIDKQGKQLFMNQKEVLDFVAQNKEKARNVPVGIDHGNDKPINELIETMKKWLNRQAKEEIIQEDGSKKTLAGSETMKILSGLKYGDSSAVKRVKDNITVDEKYQPDNFDLITWLLVS